MINRIVSMFMAAVIGAGLVLTGCQQLPGTRQEQATVLGGAVGAAAGHEIGNGGALGTIIGAVAGGALGAYIGKRMDEQDRQNVAQSLSQDQPLAWNNPKTDTTYRVNPTDTFERNGQVCRDYTMTIDVEGQPREAQGTACRQPDGTWRVVS